MELFIYLLKVTGCTAAFYLVYYTLFRKLTFFSLNRWYLLVTLVFSLSIPLLHIRVQTTIPAPDVKPLLINTATQPIDDVSDPVILQKNVPKHINWVFVATCVYSAITVALLIKLLITLGGIIYKAYKHGKRQNGYLLVDGINADNSSFFKYIFLNGTNLDTNEKEQVITHELIHAKLVHSADNLFTEVLKALLWFNPFVYLYTKALHQAHEFEVDRHLADQYDSKTYAGLLLKLSMPSNIGVSNQFSAYGLKSRVQMLFRVKSATAKKLGYLLTFPIVATLVYFLAIDKVYAYSAGTVADKNFVLVLDAGHGGKQSGSVSPDGIYEKDINLAIVKEIKILADRYGIKTILTRASDQDVSLNARLKAQGSLFLSIHVNKLPLSRQEHYNGIALLINKNKNYELSKYLAHVFMDNLKQLNGISTPDTIADNQHVKILKENTAPALLLELGYMSNKSDWKYISDKQNQQAVAQKCINAIIAYQISVETKKNGAIVPPDSGTKVSVNIALANDHKTGNPSKQDKSSKLSSANKKDAGTSSKDHLNWLKIAMPFDEGTQLRYTAKDSTRGDNANKALYLYGAATMATNRFNISASTIRYSYKDSLVFASGNVKLQLRDGAQTSYSPAMEMDSLTINLKTNHAINKRYLKGFKMVGLPH